MILNLIDRLAGKWFDWRADMMAKDDHEEARFRKVEVTQNGIEMDIIHSGVATFADNFSELLDKNNIKNYLQFDIKPRPDRNIKPIRVTVQWAIGKSPAEINAILKNGLLDIARGISTNSANKARDILGQCGYDDEFEIIAQDGRQ